MTRAELLAFLRRHKLGVVATFGPTAPQSAVVGVAFTDRLEVVFDTLGDTRKAVNLRRDPRVSLVVGWEQETVQLEGVADEPHGADLAALQRAYFAVYPDGVERQAWPGITYVRIRPRWARYSDFRVTPPRIVDLTHFS